MNHTPRLVSAPGFALCCGLLACSGQPQPATDSEGPTDTAPHTDDNDSDDDSACIEDDGVFSDISSSAPTTAGAVARVEWTAQDATQTWVRYLDTLEQSVDLPRDPSGGATLRGLLPSSDVSYRLVAQVGDQRFCSEARTASTSALPAGLPELALTLGTPQDVSPAFMSTSVLTPDKRFAVVLDTMGEVVWAWEAPEDVAPGVPLYRVAFSKDGRSLLVNTHSTASQPGAIWRIPWDGQDVTTHRLDNIHRDFAELSDGTIAYFAHESRRFESGEEYRGDVIIEMSPDGESTQAWNLWEDYDHGLGPSEVLDSLDCLCDYAHANALHYDPNTDAYLVTLPELGSPESPQPRGSLLSVDRQTAGTNWELSYSRGDFEIVGTELAIESPHSMQLVEGGVLVFNRGSPDSCSRATEVALDPSIGTAQVVWQSSEDPCLHVIFLGESRRLDDGDTLVMYSSAGSLEVVGPDGLHKWRLQADLGAGFGFVDRTTTLAEADRLR